VSQFAIGIGGGGVNSTWMDAEGDGRWKVESDITPGTESARNLFQKNIISQRFYFTMKLFHRQREPGSQFPFGVSSASSILS
jgi:hypothetical protein